MKALRISVSGFVQGVGYRRWAWLLGRSMKISGYVMNRLDGSVEIMAIGEEEALARLLGQLREGPPWAEVDEVRFEELESIPPGKWSTFEVRHD